MYTKANCKYMLLSLQCGGLTTRTHLVKVAKGKCHEARANLGMYAQPSLCNYLLTKMPREINRSFAMFAGLQSSLGGCKFRKHVVEEKGGVRIQKHLGQPQAKATTCH